MSKTLKALVLGILILSGVSLCMLAVDVSGAWELTFRERALEMKIEQDGEKIKVTTEGFRGSDMIGEGTVKGNKIEWTVTMSTERGEFSMSFKGAVKGDTMSGEVSLGERGTMEWSAKKK